MKNCQTLTCAVSTSTTAANAFNNFASEVRAIPMPTGQTSADAANLASAASHVAGIYSALAAATTASQYDSIASGLTPAANQFQRDYTTLANDLSNS